EAFELRDELLHPLAAGLDVELGSLEGLGIGRQQPLHRAHETPAERIRSLTNGSGGLIPPRAQRAHLLEQVRRSRRLGALRRQQRLQFLEQRLAIGLARLELDLVAALVAIAEVIGRGAEPAPERFRLAAADRPDGLPLGLQAPELGRRPVPLARVGELFRPRTERFLLRLVRRPDFLALREILVAPREEVIAGIAE